LDASSGGDFGSAGSDLMSMGSAGGSGVAAFSGAAAAGAAASSGVGASTSMELPTIAMLFGSRSGFGSGAA
jgi:hypothetical protein